MSDELRPWERQEDEPARWFRRFEAFRLLGVSRTIEAVFRAESTAKGSKGKHRPSRHWYGAAQEWSWLERAQAWDASLIAEREAVIQATQAEIDARWREKAMREAEALGRLAEIGRASPADFLEREPQSLELGEGENKMTIWIESASLKWDALRERGYLVKKISFNQYGPIIEMKDSSGAIEKIGENLNLWRQQSGANLNVDLSQLTDEQLERIANGEDPVAVMATSSPGRA